MNFTYKKLNKDLKFEKRLEITCSMNSAKCEFTCGNIINIDKTNISVIEPHRVNIIIKSYNLLVLYFDKDNLFLYNRSNPITVSELANILKKIVAGEYNG